MKFVFDNIRIHKIIISEILFDIIDNVIHYCVMAYETTYVCDPFLSIHYYQIVNFSLPQTLLKF